MIDASDEDADAKTAVTQRLIEELGASEKPRLYVYNKCDLGIAAHPVGNGEESVFISAATGDGVSQLVEKLEALAASGKHECIFRFPPEKLGLLNLLYDGADVKEVDYREDGARVVAVCDGKISGRLAAYRVED